MAIEREGTTWLTTEESAELFETTWITFKKHIDGLGVKGRRFSGQGQRVFYKRSIVERLRDTPEERLPELRKALIAEGEASAE